MTIILLGLGSNLGDRLGHLQAAIEHLRRSRIRVFRCSSVYETEPVGVVDQADFLNMAVVARTPLGPEAVLEVCHEIEQSLGRRRPETARTIDIDLLYYGTVELASDQIEVPHPRLHERRFVLEPLNEIAPDFVDPVRNKTVGKLLEKCPDGSRVVRYSTGEKSLC